MADPADDGRVAPTQPTVRWSCAAIVVLCLVIGLPTVRSDNYFLGDDFGLVHHLHDLPVGRLLSYFVSDWTEGIYGFVLDELRPGLALTYWLDAHLFGAANAIGYHATNVALHIVNALLVLAISRSIAPREPAFALLAGSLFAVMPSHAEPIAWISGRVDSLAAVFHLGAFLCFVRFRLGSRRIWLLAALLIFACGLFAKQSLVTFPALILAYDLFAAGSKDSGRSMARLWPQLPFFALTALYLALRHTLFGNAVRGDTITAATIKEFIVRQQFYGRELLPTANGWSLGASVAAETFTLGMLAVFGGWLLARRPLAPPVAGRLLFFGPVWYAITILPMVVTYASPRHLYITTAGLSIAVASLVLPGRHVEPGRRMRMRTAMGGVLIALYAAASTGNVSGWVARGIESHGFASAVPRLLESVPRDSAVFVDVPDLRGDIWFWSWATPFALQPPFTAEDLYEKFKIVEQPPVYCCPPDQWWPARRATVMGLMQSPEPQQVTFIRFRPKRPETPAFEQRVIDGPTLKREIEAALGKSVESFAAGITPEEADQLGRMLFKVATIASVRR